MNDTSTFHPPLPPPRTWSSFFSGLIVLVLGIALMFLAQVVAVVIMVSGETMERGGELERADVMRISVDGDLLGIAFPLGMIAVIALVSIVVTTRRRRPVGEYIGLVPIPAGALARWVIVGWMLLGVSIVFGILFGRPDVPEWLAAVFPTIDRKLLFFLAIVVCAPVAEEVLYRGYVLRAWLDSRLSPNAAVVLVSAAWAVTHIQYDLYDSVWVFILGLLLAWARIRSQSLYAPIAIHCAWNLVSLVGLEIYFA